jgi:hypothetical protein
MDNIKTPNMEVTGLDELSKKLDRLQAKDSQMEERITKIIREAIKAARSMVAADAKGAVGNDPRHAYKAVRSMVYKRILGGNISILQKRKAGSGKSGYEPPRTLRPGQRGGNRVPRSARTQQMMDYEGSDRGFILRFLNSGTGQRTAGTRNGRLHGNRGSIAARNWFPSSGQRAMNAAAQYIIDEIDRLIAEEFGK